MLQVLGQDTNHRLCLQYDSGEEAGKQQARKTRALDMFLGGSHKYNQQKSTHPINQQCFSKHHGQFPHTNLDHAGCDTPVSHCPRVYLVG